jgi:hypothetical protein
MSYDQTLHMLFVRSNIFMSYFDYLLFDLQWAPQKMRCGQIVNVYLFATSRIASSQKKEKLGQFGIASSKNISYN